MNPSTMYRYRPAFTLIEMMLAISIGLMVVLVATAGFRAASKALAVANRLTVENQLIGLGIEAVGQELDYWTAYDDPSAPDGSPRKALRQGCKLQDSTRDGWNMTFMTLNDGTTQSAYSSSISKYTVITSKGTTKAPYQGINGQPFVFGLPFSPLRNSWGSESQLGGSNNGYQGQFFGQKTWVSESEHEDDVWSISARNHLTWWTGNLQCGLGFVQGITKSGNILSRSDRSKDTMSWEIYPAVVRRGYPAISGVSQGASPYYSDVNSSPAMAIIGVPLSMWKYDFLNKKCMLPMYGTMTWEMSNRPYDDMVGGLVLSGQGWIFNQIRGLEHALGFYGMLDYLPAGMIPAYMQAELPDDPVYRSNSMTTLDWDHFPYALTYGYANAYWQSPNITRHANQMFENLKFSEVNLAASDHKISLTNQLLYPGGYSIIPWANEWDQQGIKLKSGGSQLTWLHPDLTPDSPLVSPPSGKYGDLVFYHRSAFAYGDLNQLSQGTSTTTSAIIDADPNGRLRSLTAIDTNLNASNVGWWANEGLALVSIQSGTEADSQLIQRYLARTTAKMRLFSMRPMDWPDVQISVAHHLRQNRYANQAKVAWFDPVTGKSFDLRFGMIGTTLRGARRQRQASPGQSLDQ